MIKSAVIVGCWNSEPHERPSFQDVIKLLDDIKRSPFVLTTHESFRDLQEDWHQEIEEMFQELRTKEKVYFCVHAFCIFCYFYICIVRIHV